MKLGSDILFEKHSDLIEGKRLAVLAHMASLDSNGTHIIDKMLEGEKTHKWKLSAIFAPEHGLDGIAQDMEPVKSSKKEKVPIHSLYGETFASLSPTPEMLKDVDVLIVDLQDIGSRYYTYVNTMVLCIRVCHALKIKVIVCDRPNPINGVTKEGGGVESEFRSFVGMFDLPVRHAMTIGEIAEQFSPSMAQVIHMQGWNREHYWDHAGLKWVNPSPNMRSLTSALLYPGMCLLEGTNVSEGRGTHTPFETMGAPWMDGEELARKMHALRLKGIDFDPVVFTPTSRKFENERCEGLQFIITDRKVFRPYLTGLALIHTIAATYPRDFKWRREPYEFVSDIPAIDLLTGNGKFRKLVDKKRPFEEIAILTSL